MKKIFIILLMVFISCGSITTIFPSKPVENKTNEQIEEKEINKKAIKVVIRIVIGVGVFMFFMAK